MDEIQIVRGRPTDEELAAIAAALLLVPGAAPPARPPVSRWARAARPVHPWTTVRGPDAWRASALPAAGGARCT